MALIKCDECKKEISDTVEKCPHCGYKIKNNFELKKINIKELFEKIKNNKKLLYSIIGGLLVIVILCTLVIGNKKDRYAKKVISYLESNGYVCTKGTYNVGHIDENIMEKSVRCILKEEKEEYQYIVRSKKKFDVQFIYKGNHYTNEEFSFRLAPYIVYESDIISLYKNGEKHGKYASTGSTFMDGKAKVDAICDDNYYYKNKDQEKCSDLRDYLKDVNEAIDNYKKLYKDLEIDMTYDLYK